MPLANIDFAQGELGVWQLDHISSTDKEEILLENSFHVATLDYDAELIEKVSADFIKRLINA